MTQAFEWSGTPDELLSQLERINYGSWAIRRDEEWSSTFVEYGKANEKPYRSRAGHGTLHYKHGGGYIGNAPIADLSFDEDGNIMVINILNSVTMANADILLHLLKKKAQVVDV